jgi:hypothetical protein
LKPPRPLPDRYQLDFTDWMGSSYDQRRLLLTVVGECGGEWWGDGRVEFRRMEDALRAVCRLADLEMAGLRPS